MTTEVGADQLVVDPPAFLTITGHVLVKFWPPGLRYLQREKKIKGDPFKQLVSAISVGIYKGVPVLDLDYPEDSKADTDLNVVMTENAELIEVQGTAEAGAFSRQELNAMLDLAEKAGEELREKQREALGIRG